MTQNFNTLADDFRILASTLDDFDIQVAELDRPYGFTPYGEIISCFEGDDDCMALSEDSLDPTSRPRARTPQEIAADELALDGFIEEPKEKNRFLASLFKRSNTANQKGVVQLLREPEIVINEGFHWIINHQPDQPDVGLFLGATLVTEHADIASLMSITPDEIKTRFGNDVDGFCALIEQLRDDDSTRILVDAGLANNQAFGEIYFDYLEQKEDGLALADLS